MNFGPIRNQNPLSDPSYEQPSHPGAPINVINNSLNITIYNNNIPAPVANNSSAGGKRVA